MKKLWAVSVSLLAVLAACGSTTPAAPGAAAPALAGTSWTVTQLNGTDVLATAVPTLEFGDDAVAGSASCNRFNAGFSQSGATVTIMPGAQTAMACADDVMAQEQAFTAALAKVTGVRAAGDGVELVDASDAALLTLAAVVDVPLEGTTWTLSGVISGDAVASPAAGGDVTMTIVDGTLSGKACNTFRGSVTAADGRIEVGPLMSTKMACTSAELTAQENAVLKTLQAASSYTVKGNSLTVTAADGTGLTFTAA